MNQRCVTGMQTRLLYQSREQSQSNHAPASAHALFPDEFVARSQRQRARGNNKNQSQYIRFATSMHIVSKYSTSQRRCHHSRQLTFLHVYASGERRYRAVALPLRLSLLERLGFLRCWDWPAWIAVATCISDVRSPVASRK